MNASTTDPNSTVEQSALTRDRVEDLMLERESQFKEKQEEQARLLDELAGKLQSLDLSAAAEMVRLGVWSPFLWFLGDKTSTNLLPCSSITVCRPVGVTAGLKVLGYTAKLEGSTGNRVCASQPAPASSCSSVQPLPISYVCGGTSL